MKNAIIQSLFVLAFGFSANASVVDETGKDVRANDDFVATCPEQFLTYIDKSEGGPGAYCACPEENIGYIDIHEGGQGFFCSETPLN
ncbi:MAG: hypothetical protein EOP09_15285 [Proteobacteria bacterium]|nr:MAG: hypothetical protein EOP09_15285 [Pseudomonadota bacterium]